jgi:hypothetical protein
MVLVAKGGDYVFGVRAIARSENGDLRYWLLHMCKVKHYWMNGWLIKVKDVARW